MTTQNNAQVDKLLTNVSNKIMPEGYISEQILPLIQVKQTTGLLGGYGKNHLRLLSNLHSGSGKYPRVSSNTENTQRYILEKHALSDVVTEEDYKNKEKPFDAELDKMMDLMSLLWTEKEVALSNTLGNTSIITQNVTLSGTDQYSDESGSNPLSDFATARGTIEDVTGQKPNLAVMSAPVARQLKKHPELLDRLGFKQNKIGMISDEELAMVLDVDRVLIGRAVYNSAKEGQADSITPVWGKNIIFMVAPRTAQRRQISLGYRIQTNAPRRVFKNDLKNPPMSKEILVDDWYDQLISDVTAGYLIKDAVA